MRLILIPLIVFVLVIGDVGLALPERAKQQNICLPQEELVNMTSDLERCADCGQRLQEALNRAWELEKENSLVEWYQGPIGIALTLFVGAFAGYALAQGK